MSKPSLVLDLGGSVVNGGKLDPSFLHKFQDFIKGYLKNGVIFYIIVGGGVITRLYQNFLQEHFTVTSVDLDMVGIRPTMLNAELIRIILKDYAYPYVLESPYERIKNEKVFNVFVFSGWRGKTGWSTDYVALSVAKRFNVQEVISLSNIKGVYNVEKGKLRRDKVIPRLTFQDYERMIAHAWAPGMKVPFDPVATKEAKKKGIRAVILEGTNLDNVKRYLEGKEFLGTIIS